MTQKERKEDLFESAFKGKPSGHIKYEDHPSERLLVDYIYQDLEEEVFSEVSIHVATCKKCSKQVTELRKKLTTLSEGLFELVNSKLTPREEKQKTAIYQLAAEFIKKFYPDEIQFLKDLWGFLRKRSLSQIADYDYQRVPSSIGTFSLGEGAEKIGENAVISLASIASVFEQEQATDITTIPQNKLKKLLKKKARSKGASSNFANQLSNYLS